MSRRWRVLRGCALSVVPALSVLIARVTDPRPCPPGDAPAVDAVLRHPAARGIRADVPGLVVPLTAAGWRADDIRRLLDAIPADAPGLVVRALRDAALSPPPASSTSRPSGHRGWCRKHDRERTATGKCSACRSEALAAPASPTLICSLRR